MADYIHDITALLPQGPPFVMVDKLLYSDGHITCTTFRITPGNPLVEKGRLSAAGLIENIAQTVAAGAGYAARAVNESVRPGYIISVKDLEIRALPEIEAELMTEITITARVADIIVISGKTTCNGKVIATGEMKILTSV
jgi:predicted hotdog family 3-hydroxylacyl-ACP dehydratase